MNRAIGNLGLGSIVLAVSSCGSDPNELTAGIEGSGIHQNTAITSAGAVTELGSIFVNGVRFDLAGATITLDGQPANESDLDVGSLVIVEGTLNAGGTTGRALRVTAGTAVAGPIDSIDIAREGFTVLGQNVEVDSATVFEQGTDGLPLGGLNVGSDVEVAGFADSAGTIRARRVVQRSAGRPLLLTGYVSALDAANYRFAINGATVDYSGATLTGLSGGLSDGAAVRVTAATVAADGAIAADEVAYRDLRMPGDVGDGAVLQGWVTRYASATDFDIDGRRVTASDAGTNVALDSFVAVRGAISENGVVDLEALLTGGSPKVRVTDANGDPIEGAMVAVMSGGTQYVATTDSNGIATIVSFPGGEGIFTISAPGFETVTFSGGLGYGEYYGWTLIEEGAWALGRPIVLDTRYVDRASDGSSLTFALDLAVIDASSMPIETLTSADFSIGHFDCGWGGSLDCASDAAGNHTGNYVMGGHPSSFAGIQPAGPRVPYLIEILAVRSDRIDWRTDRRYWETLAPALNSFVAGIGGNDLIGLSSVQIEDGVTTQTLHGPFTSDGSIYAEVIDGLGQPAGHDWPPIVEGLAAAIHRTAQARDAAAGSHGAGVLVLGQPWLEAEEIAAVSALAGELGVHVSTVDYWGTYGVPDIAMRTGGIVARVADSRQFPMVFNALDDALARSLPFYRMEFELTGDAGTFVSGGNAKIRIHIQVPTLITAFPIEAVTDVAIP